MQSPDVRNDWLEKGVALLFATVAVLGVTVVAATLSLFLAASSGGSIPIP